MAAAATRAMDSIEGLTHDQITGIHAGLTREQVAHDWFLNPHACAATAGIDYEEYQGLIGCEVREGILKGLVRAQVEGLNPNKIKGVHAGLTREQVAHDWFQGSHARAATAGIDYKEYQGLSYVQVEEGILKGLVRAQVEGLNVTQLRLVRAHSLPSADIVRSLSGTALETAVNNYLLDSQRVAFASVFCLTRNPESTAPALPAELVAKICEYHS